MSRTPQRTAQQNPRGRALWISGILALVAFDLALNFALLRQEFFSRWVIVPLLTGLILGVLWAALRLTRIAGEAAAEQTSRRLNAVIASIVFFFICVALYAFARHGDLGWDLTEQGRRSLAPQTIQLLESLTQDVEVYSLFIISGDNLPSVTREKTRRFLERCQQHTPHLNLTFIDPEDDPLVAQRLELPRLSRTGTVVLKSGSRQQVIPLSGPTPRLTEREFTRALVNVVRAAKPKVYFLQGHGERDPRGAGEEGGGTLWNLLKAESYEVDILQLDPRDSAVPPDCDLLVMYGQQRDLMPSEIPALEAYAAQGGRFLIFIDLWMVDRSAGLPNTEQLRPWLAEEFGIAVGDDLLLTQRPARGTSPATIYLLPRFGQEGGAQSSFDAEHPITRGINSVMSLTGVRSVRLAEELPGGAVGDVLLRTPPDCWAEQDVAALAGGEQPQKDPSEPEGSLPLAVAVTKPTETPVGDTGQMREARAVVVGNREFASNRQVAQQPLSSTFVMNAFAWLTESPELMGMRAQPRDQQAPIVLTPAQEQIVAWVSSLGLLHLIVLVGGIVYFVRGRRQ